MKDNDSLLFVDEEKKINFLTKISEFESFWSKSKSYVQPKLSKIISKTIDYDFIEKLQNYKFTCRECCQFNKESTYCVAKLDTGCDTKESIIDIHNELDKKIEKLKNYLKEKQINQSWFQPMMEIFGFQVRKNKLNKKIIVKVDQSLHIEQYDIVQL